MHRPSRRSVLSVRLLVASGLVLGCGFALGLAPASAIGQPAPHTAPPAPQSPMPPPPMPPPPMPPPPQDATIAPAGARTVADCAAIPFAGERHRCKKCVTHGARFTFGAPGSPGYCAAEGQPLATAGSMLSQVPQCNIMVGGVLKRRRCRDCIANGGTFATDGPGPGRCLTRAEPGPPAAVPSGQVIGSFEDCAARIHPPGHQRKCVKCVQEGGFFHTDGHGPGHCVRRVPVAPPAPPVAAPSAPSAPAAPGALRTADECRASLPGRAPRRQCERCAQQGGAFRAANLQCDFRPGSTITAVGACFNQLDNPGLQRGCERCLRKGGVFLRTGACYR